MGKSKMKNNLAFITLFTVVATFNLLGCNSKDIKTTSLPKESLESANTDTISIEGRKIPVSRSMGDYIGFSSEDKLFQIADLVVIGKPMANLDETSFISSSELEATSRKNQGNESVIVTSRSGNRMDFYSIVSFKVQKYLKGDFKEKQIKVLQPAAYIQSKKNPPYALFNEDSFPLQKKSRYVLYLKEVDATYPNLAGIYSIISVNQGKFNLDASDLQESEIERKNDQYRKLKEKVKNRHGKVFNSTPDL